MASDVSPWSRFKTTHPMSFNPSTMMNCYDPVDGLEYVFMGDDKGFLYRMEGTAGRGDGGTFLFPGSSVKMERLSKTIIIPENMDAFTIVGWIRYRKISPVTLKLAFEFQGEQIYTETINVELEGAEASAYYGGQYFYGGESYYGSNLPKVQT